VNDIVISSLLDSFTESYGSQDFDESEQVERFRALSVLTKHSNYSLSNDDLNDFSVVKTKELTLG
jgi:hypothetical protein